MKDEALFRAALADKQLPILLLDEKWHRLFAIHGKPEQLLSTERELNELMAEQGRCNQELKDLRKLKSALMGSIIQNMDGTSEEKASSIESRKLDENRRLIEEINEKLDVCTDRLLELPQMIQEKNRQLMVATMEYGYDKMRVNEREAEEISEWIAQIRIELKKNIIRKQNCEANSREIYTYMHDIFGPQIIDLYDIQFEYEEDEDEEETVEGESPSGE